jgi:hypothetical protein
MILIYMGRVHPRCIIECEYKSRDFFFQQRHLHLYLTFRQLYYVSVLDIIPSTGLKDKTFEVATGICRHFDLCPGISILGRRKEIGMAAVHAGFKVLRALPHQMKQTALKMHERCSSKLSSKNIQHDDSACLLLVLDSISRNRSADEQARTLAPHLWETANVPSVNASQT